MIRAFVLLLLSGCSILFDPADPAERQLAVDGDGSPIPVDGDGSILTLDGGPADGSSLAIDAAAYDLQCNPFNDPGDCGCRVDNDPLGGPSCGIVGSKPLLASCESSRECDTNLFCTGFTGTPGACRLLCGGHLAVGCGGPTCVSVWWDGFYWWGYCP